jgi:hypothetical protein
MARDLTTPTTTRSGHWLPRPYRASVEAAQTALPSPLILTTALSLEIDLNCIISIEFALRARL